VIPVPLTVIVASYVPAGTEATGLTVKVLLPCATVTPLPNEVFDKSKRLAPAPERVIVNSPVSALPVLVIVIVAASGREEYPAVASKLIRDVGLIEILRVAEAAVTVKLRVVVREVSPVPLTVTVAVYVPTARPVLGTTVNSTVPFAAEMLASEVVDSVNELAFVPESATVIAPVAIVPVLVTVSIRAVGRFVYPTSLSEKE